MKHSIRFGNTIIIIGLPLMIFIIYFMMFRLPDLRLSVPEWIGGCALITVLIALGWYLGENESAAWSSGFIISMGALFRVLFLMRPPELSDDIFRYLFDGQVFLSGGNPYYAAPLDTVSKHPSLSGLAALINHADLPTIYPPAAQLVFAAGAFLGGVFGMKLFLVVLDILSCVLMARILHQFGRPQSCLVLYAWHPLPVMEIGGSGHIDSAVIFFTFMSLFFLMRSTFTTGGFKSIWHSLSGWAAGFFLAAAVLTKWLPLMFLPGVALLSCSGNRRPAVCGFLLGGVAMMGFFWPEVQNGFHTLSIYAANWEFSGFAFRMLRAVSGSGGIARLFLAAVFTAVAGIVYFRCYRAIGGFRQGKTAGDGLLIFKAVYSIVISFLVLTPTLHPWYALYLAALLPFTGGAAGMVFSWSVFSAYRVMILYGMTGQWIENDFFPMLLLAGPMAAWMLAVISRYTPGKFREKSWNHFPG
jgi:hypothetical protein